MDSDTPSSGSEDNDFGRASGALPDSEDSLGDDHSLDSNTEAIAPARCDEESGDSDLERTPVGLSLKEISQRSQELYSFHYVDITNEFVDVEKFLISGDGMIWELLGHELLDFLHGPPLLQLTYMVEKFLADFASKHGHFVVVFFTDLVPLWHAYGPGVTFVYYALRRHLEGGQFCDSLSFASPFGLEFSQMLSDTSFSFILLSNSNGADLAERWPAGLINTEYLGDWVWAWLISGCVQNQLNVALFSNLTQEISTCWAYFLDTNGSEVKQIGVLAHDFNCATVAKLQTLGCPETRATGVEFSNRFSFWTPILSNCCEKLSEVNTNACIAIFLLHLHCMDFLSLDQRGLGLAALMHPSAAVIDLLKFWSLKFLPHALSLASNALKSITADFMTCDSLPVYDLLDGRLCMALVAAVLNLDSATITDLEGAIAALAPELSIPARSLNFGLENGKPVQRPNLATYQMPSPTLSAYQIDNPLVTAYLDVELAEKWKSAPLLGHLGECSFFENYHWHSGKAIVEEFDNAASAQQPNQGRDSRYTLQWLRNRALRNEQKYSAFMKSYGSSLTGPDSQKSTIIAGEKDVTEVCRNGQRNEARVVGKKKQGPGKKVGIKTADKIKLDNSKRIEADNEKKEMRRIKFKEASYELDFLKEAKLLKSTEAKKELLLRGARLQWKLVEESSHAGGDQNEDIISRNAVTLVAILKMLKTELWHALTEKERGQWTEIFQALGFGDRPGILGRGLSLVDFQLAHGGALLDIQNNPTPDDRVHFTPDEWQRKLLDVIDGWQSALISAPTSSGKTFCSFYCVEQVLRESKNGVVVFVVPTKALVNQVAAVMCARYSDVKLEAGFSVYGVFTRDYRHAVMTSRVLVTVPEGFEILALTPRNREWFSRIRYVVMDEFHCIGTGIGGRAWEKLILLIRCPFLALSATISNPDELHGWLQETEHAKRVADEKAGCLRPHSTAYDVQLVIHRERYAELELYACLPGDPIRKHHDMKPLHPFGILDSASLRFLDFRSSDVTLTASQVYHLQACLVENQFNVRNPNAFFQQKDWLKRSELRAYETELKNSIQRIVEKAKQETESMENDRLVSAFQGMQGFVSRAELDASRASRPERSKSAQDMECLVRSLKHEEKLPCIVFSDHRQLCERYAEYLAETLEKKEDRKTQNEPGLRKELATYRNALMEALRITYHERPLRTSREERNESKILQQFNKESIKKQQNAADRRKRNETAASMVEDSIDDGRILPPFPKNADEFTLRKPGLESSLFVDILRRVANKLRGTERFRMVLRCLSRGIGFHHSGCSTVEKQAVETLFRAGFLGVVFSTQTLALGIHMPCRTVVFADDSRYLTPLQYRQMSGRAGRRGFDTVGNVVFGYLPTKKIIRLIMSDLPRLRGNVPFTVSDILRLFIMVSETENKRPGEAIAQALRVLRMPLLRYTLDPSDLPTLELALQTYFAFSTQVLRHWGFLDCRGNAIDFAGLASHLHYHQPANLLFCAMLREGLFHQLYDDHDNDTDRRDDLIVIMAYLFTKLPSPHNLDKAKLHNSRVIMDPLPDDFDDFITNYNQDLAEFCQNFYRSARRLSLNESLNPRLPLSKKEVGFNGTLAEDRTLSPNYGLTPILASLKQNKLENVAVNPFFGLSGVKDSDVSLTQSFLVSPILEEILLDMSLIPSVAHPWKNHRGTVIRRNGYAVDFLRHNIVQDIVHDNGIQQGECFSLLKDFLLVLKAVAVSLDQLASCDDPVVAMFANLADEFAEAFNKGFTGYSTK